MSVTKYKGQSPNDGVTNLESNTFEENQVAGSGSLQEQNEVTVDEDDNESEFSDIDDSDDVYESKNEEIRQAKKEEAEDYDDEVEEPKQPKGIFIP